MKRKINGKLLLFSVLILILGIVLLGVMFCMEHGAGSSFQAHLYSTKHRLHSGRLRNMGLEGYLGLLAFGLIALGCYGIFKGIQGSSSEKEVQLQMPPVSCILQSAVLVFAGGAALYFNLFQGRHGISSTREAILAVLFIFLGGLVFLEECREKNIDTGIKTGSLWMRKKWKKQKKIDLFVRIARIRWRKKNLIVPSAAESYRKRCKEEILSLLRPRDEKRTMVLAENAAREFPIETDLFQKN